MPIYVLYTIAATYRFSNYCSVRSEEVVRALSWGLVAGALVYLALNTSNFDLSPLVGTERNAGIFDYNLNLVDDVYVFLILIAFLGASVALKGAPRIGDRCLAVLLLAIFAYAFVYLIQGQSRGAWIAFIVSFLTTAIIALASGRRFAVSKVAISVAVLIVVLKMDTVWHRAEVEEIPSTNTIGKRLLGPVDPPHAGVPFGKAAAMEHAATSTNPTTVEPGYIGDPSPTSSKTRDEQDSPPTESITPRLKLWRDAFNLITYEPITGMLGRDLEKIEERSLYPQFTMKWAHFHNLFLDVTVRFGLILLSVYLFLFLFVTIAVSRVLLVGVRKDDYHASGLAAIALFFFVYLFIENLVDLNFYQKEIISLIISFSAITGVALSLSRHEGPERGLRIIASPSLAEHWPWHQQQQAGS